MGLYNVIYGHIGAAGFTLGFSVVVLGRMIRGCGTLRGEQ